MVAAVSYWGARLQRIGKDKKAMSWGFKVGSFLLDSCSLLAVSTLKYSESIESLLIEKSE